MNGNEAGCRWEVQELFKMSRRLRDPNKGRVRVWMGGCEGVDLLVVAETIHRSRESEV